MSEAEVKLQKIREKLLVIEREVAEARAVLKGGKT